MILAHSSFHSQFSRDVTKKMCFNMFALSMFTRLHSGGLGISLPSLSSLYSASIYTPRTERKCSRGEYFSSRYAVIARSDSTDAIALLRFCETIACNSTKMIIFGSILHFSGKNENRDPTIFFVNMKIPS